jgi:hypothetical protein
LARRMNGADSNGAAANERTCLRCNNGCVIETSLNEALCWAI